MEQAEDVERQLQDQLAGRTPETRPEDSTRTLAEGIKVFLDDKKVQGRHTHFGVGVTGRVVRLPCGPKPLPCL
jgi:hypothetical protein